MPSKNFCKNYPKGQKLIYYQTKLQNDKSYWDTRQNTTRDIAKSILKREDDKSFEDKISESRRSVITNIEYSEAEAKDLSESAKPYMHFFTELEKVNGQRNVITWASKYREQIPIVKTTLPVDEFIHKFLNSVIEEFAVWLMGLDVAGNNQNMIQKIKDMLIIFEDRHISRAFETEIEEIPQKVDFGKQYHKIIKKLSAADEYFVSEEMWQPYSVKREHLIQNIFDNENFSDEENMWEGTENYLSTREFYKWLHNNKKSVPKYLTEYYKRYFKNIVIENESQ